MPAYNFSKYRAPLIQNCTLKQTIRPVRKLQTKPGDPLQLYQGQQTRHPTLLRVEVCKSVELISIFNKKNVVIGDQILNDAEILVLSKADGFNHLDEFIDFYDHTYGLPFHGELIKW